MSSESWRRMASTINVLLHRVGTRIRAWFRLDPLQEWADAIED